MVTSDAPAQERGPAPAETWRFNDPEIARRAAAIGHATQRRQRLERRVRDALAELRQHADNGNAVDQSVFADVQATLDAVNIPSSVTSQAAELQAKALRRVDELLDSPDTKPADIVAALRLLGAPEAPTQGDDFAARLQAAYRRRST